MPDKVDDITARMNRVLSLGRNNVTDSASTSSRAEGFSQAQKEEIKAIVSEFFDKESLEDDSDHPIGDVRLEELDKIPDIIKSIREFSGRAGEFGSWRKSVDRALQLFESIKGTSRYYAILHTIRTKIVGEADTALDSYRTPLDWGKMGKCLMMHYSDKRDIGTLEYQMTTLCQGNRSITEFYQAVYQHLSLILDKVACLELDSSSLCAMTSAYREKALDTFIRGLRGDLPRLLSVREPSSLPQALHMCLKLDNMSYRINHAHGQRLIPQKHQPSQLGARPKFYPELAYTGGLYRPPIPTRLAPKPMPIQTYQYQHQNRPPFNLYQNRNTNANVPSQLYQQQNSNNVRGPVPMDVDRSVQTKQVNYVNRPPFNNTIKRPHESYQGPANKFQRTFHLGTGGQNNVDCFQQADEAPDNFSDQVCYGEVIERENIEGLTSDHPERVEETGNDFDAYSIEDLNADLNFFG